MTTVKDILITHLKAIGADGLCNEECECGCSLARMPDCGEFCQDCEPGRFVQPDPDDFMYDEYPEGYFVSMEPNHD